MPPPLGQGVIRVFELSVGEMLRSRRTLFMALVAAGPVLLAGVARLTADDGLASGASLFGVIVWLFFARFCAPVFGAFYGASLIADEVEDQTLTYLFTRPVRRGAVLLGKYLAYLSCSAAVLLPSLVAVYVLLVPFGDMAAGSGELLQDLGVLLLGLAVYGALFAFMGTVLTRPLVAGLVFAFLWEPLALALPGYLRRLTIAGYLQALVPHAMPADGTISLLQAVFRDEPSKGLSLGCLLAVLVISLTAAVRAIERREYLLGE